MIRLTDKLSIFANARLCKVMDRRKAEGRSVIDARSARCVLFALLNRSDQDGCCHPSLGLVAEESDVPLRTVQAVLAVLQDEGLVTIQHRHRVGAGADRTNVYRIEWTALEQCSDGGVRTKLPKAPPLFAGERSNCAHESAATAPTRAQPLRPGERSSPAPTGRSSSAPSGRSGERASKEEPPIEPLIEPPPYPPEGDRAVGGASALQGQQTEQPDRRSAGEIREAYPCHATDSPLPLADEDAVISALVAERARGSGIGAAEILAAARRVRSDVAEGRLRTPLRLRVWASQRGYLAAAEAARQAAAPPVQVAAWADPEAAARAIADQAAQERAERRRADEDLADRRRKRDEAIDADLRGLDDDGLAALRERVAQQATDQFGQGYWRRKNPHRDPALRERMAAIVRADRASVRLEAVA